eukprot:symbB.v1.2.005354.t1/scaffold301.1/size235092/6
MVSRRPGCTTSIANKLAIVGIMTAQQLIKKHRNIENILRNLDRTKYMVPEDWNFTGARSCFQPMDLSFINKSDLKEKPIDAVALRSLLIERHALQPEVINDNMRKLVFLKGCIQPRPAPTPTPTANVTSTGPLRHRASSARARPDRKKQFGTRPPATPQSGSPLRQAFFKGKRTTVEEATPIAKRRRRAVETLQQCFGADLLLPADTPLAELERLVEDAQTESQASQCTTLPGSSLFRCLSLDEEL